MAGGINQDEQGEDTIRHLENEIHFQRQEVRGGAF
jgi:hypothetical protein